MYVSQCKLLTNRSAQLLGRCQNIAAIEYGQRDPSIGVFLNTFLRSRNSSKSIRNKIISGHMTNTASIYMPIAKKNGVTCKIAHSHNTLGKAGVLGYITNLLQKSIYKNATDWFACSKVAAKWFYPAEAVAAGRVAVIPNAVDAQKFRFNYICRNKRIKRAADNSRCLFRSSYWNTL